MVIVVPLTFERTVCELTSVSIGPEPNKCAIRLIKTTCIRWPALGESLKLSSTNMRISSESHEACFCKNPQTEPTCSIQCSMTSVEPSVAEGRLPPIITYEAASLYPMGPQEPVVRRQCRKHGMRSAKYARERIPRLPWLFQASIHAWIEVAYRPQRSGQRTRLRSH